MEENVDRYTIAYVLTISLAFLGWSSFEIKKAFGRKAAMFWAILIIVWFVVVTMLCVLFMKLLTED